jgi:Tfp pilus assembly protein PilF
MRMTLLLVVAAASLGACATTDRVAMVEDGAERGSLGVAAISRGDWRTAEASLGDSASAERDPAKLINLGTVYMQSGRPGMAVSAWRLALASNNHSMVATADGRWVSTRDLAERALAKHEGAVRSATR